MTRIQTGFQKFTTSGTALGSTRPRSSMLMLMSPETRVLPSRSPITNKAFPPSLSNAANLRTTKFSSRAARAAPSRSSPYQENEHIKDSYHPHEASTSKSNDTSTPLSDNWLGAVFLRLLPGYLFYAPSFLMPIVTTAAAIGAIWGCQILAAAATLPIVRSITPLSAALTAFGTQQPWTTLTTIALSLMTAWYSFGVIPILDWILGRELRNPTPEQAQVAADDGLYRGVLYAYVALHLTVLFVVGHFICTNPSISALAFLGAAISYGISNGVGFTVAHELLHGRSWMDKTAANLLLAPLCYMHWTKSHLMHHVKVATLEDPSSARKGESLWSFIPRSVIGNIKDGYGAEAARRRAKKIPFWDTRNRSLWWAGSPILLGTLATAVYGLKGLAFLFLQAGVGILMLEIVNYIEHYGLARKKVSNGRYERVEPRHSWNATTIYTNAVSFRLQRHSDHHAHENIPYQSLKDIREAPQLPAGYPVMMLLSTIPPLYFKIMNPRVDEAAAAAALGA